MQVIPSKTHASLTCINKLNVNHEMNLIHFTVVVYFRFLNMYWESENTGQEVVFATCVAYFYMQTSDWFHQYIIYTYLNLPSFFPILLNFHSIRISQIPFLSKKI